MTAVRTMVFDALGGMGRNARAGDNPLSSLALSIDAADTNHVLTAARTITTDTAANIIAANPQLDIGDAFMIYVSVSQAFAATWAAGTGVTLAGKATVAASTGNWVLITKTGAAAVSWNVLN
jgi:hypothetical protein